MWLYSILATDSIVSPATDQKKQSGGLILAMLQCVDPELKLRPKFGLSTAQTVFLFTLFHFLDPVLWQKSTI